MFFKLLWKEFNLERKIFAIAVCFYFILALINWVFIGHFIFFSSESSTVYGIGILWFISFLCFVWLLFLKYKKKCKYNWGVVFLTLPAFMLASLLFVFSTYSVIPALMTHCFGELNSTARVRLYDSHRVSGRGVRYRNEFCFKHEDICGYYFSSKPLSTGDYEITVKESMFGILITEINGVYEPFQ